MNPQTISRAATLAAFALAVAGCSGMSHKEKDTTVGATSGAVAGAVVAGPVGAVVGGVGGAVVGNEVGKEHAAQGRPGVTGPTSATAPSPAYGASTVRNVQQALNAKGYSAGPADGQWGTQHGNRAEAVPVVAGLARDGRARHAYAERAGCLAAERSTRNPVTALSIAPARRRRRTVRVACEREWTAAMR